MGSLCGPLIVPGIMGRSYREFPSRYAIAIALIAMLRAIYMEIPLPFYIEILSSITIILILLYILRIVTSEKAL
ncbi:MAG: hypothetical protein QXE01_08465 [Sulfolobales archaeon]